MNARERKELADGQGVQTPEHQHDRMSLDGSDASPGSDVTTGPSMLQQCREVQCFEKLNGINEGTYGMVYRYGFHLSLVICVLDCYALLQNRFLVILVVLRAWYTGVVCIPGS